MKLKKRIQAKLERAFRRLEKSGYQVSKPELRLSQESIYGLGSPFPMKYITHVEVTFRINLPETDLVLGDE